MKRLVTLILLFVTTLMYAQEVEFKASAPSVVEVGEQFRLSFTLNKEGTDLQVPTLDGFELLMGPQMSHSSSFSMINGKTSQESSYTYTYIMEGLKEGVYEIPAATVKVDGKEYHSNPIKIEVIKGSGKQSNTAIQQDRPARTSANTAVNEKNLFVKVDVSRNSLYMGESLLATIKVYTKVQLTNLGRYKFPSFTGFLAEDIPSPQSISLERENYNGEIYNVGVIRKLLLFPQHTGKIQIDPFEVECMVRQQLSGGGRSFFDDFFGNFQEVRVMRRSDPVTITVKELPSANKPADFSGTVGSVQMSSFLSADTVNANDALTYKLTFSGKGNLKLLQAPAINFPLDFESYEPKATKDVKVTEQGMSGTVTFEYVLIPRYSGEYEIPALRFSYFDTKSKTYKTILGKKYKVVVRKGAEKADGAEGVVNPIQSFKKEDIRQVGEDIRYLKSGDLQLKEAGVHFFGTWSYWLSLLIPLLLFVVGGFLNRQRIKANADVARVKNRAATKMARKRLKVAASAMKNRNAELFYEEALKALWGYMSYKLNIDRAELNRDNISELLQRKQVSDELQKEFIQLLDHCEYARYAPGSNSEQEMDKLYSQCIEIITKLDKAI